MAEAQELPPGGVSYRYFAAVEDCELLCPDGQRLKVPAGTVFLSPMPAGAKAAAAPILTTWPKSQGPAASE
jgi:hypothetical protein